jgi:hypothetical protein
MKTRLRSCLLPDVRAAQFGVPAAAVVVSMNDLYGRLKKLSTKGDEVFRRRYLIADGRCVTATAISNGRLRGVFLLTASCLTRAFRLATQEKLGNVDYL